MSYEKQTWKTGDIITAPKLNHMEDGIAEGAGYTVETQAVAVVPEQTVTTAVQGRPFAMGGLVLAEGITSLDDVSDTLTITFQGQEYVCEANAVNGGKYYGGFTETGQDFSQYPFALAFESSNDVVVSGLITESAGTYTVKAMEEGKVVVPSEEFKQAVKSSTTAGVLNVPYTEDNNSITLQSSWSEISTALQNGGARLYSHTSQKDTITMNESESTVTWTIINATYSSTRGVKLYGVDAIFNVSNTIKLLSFTTTNEDGTGLTATLS